MLSLLRMMFALLALIPHSISALLLIFAVRECRNFPAAITFVFLGLITRPTLGG